MKRSAGLVRLLALLVVLLMLAGAGCARRKSGTQGLQVFRACRNIDPMVFWDPSDSFSDEIMVMHSLYETLLRYDPLKNVFEGVLAESWESSPDGLTWTFRLRPGVKFHCGHSLEARHVKESIERTISRGKGAAFIWDAVDKIETPDERTVVFRLKRPEALNLVAASAYGAFVFCVDCVKQHGDEWLTQGHDVGSGPYTVESWKRGEEVVLTRFPGYWKGWSDKYFDKVLVKVVPETGTARQMLEGGELDYVPQLPVVDIQALSKNPALRVVQTPSFQNLLGLFNTQKGPLKDKRVRQALSYAVPYQDIVNHVIAGYGSQARGCVPRGMWGHSDTVPQYTFDLEKAKQLLAQAGYAGGGFKLVGTIAAGDEDERKVAELIKSSWQQLGVDLEIRIMPWEAQWDLARSTNVAERQDVFFFYWWPDVCWPDTYLRSLFRTEKEPYFNLCYYSNPELDRLIDEARRLAATDFKAATELYVKAQTILVEDAPAIFLYDRDNVRVMSKAIEGYVDNPAYPHALFVHGMYRR